MASAASEPVTSGRQTCQKMRKRPAPSTRGVLQFNGNRIEMLTQEKDARHRSGGGPPDGVVGVEQFQIAEKQKGRDQSDSRRDHQAEDQQ